MKKLEPALTPKQKALQINLDEQIYGTFSEIGAGQETVRNFYRAGGTSGTLAKAISAYSKEFSDAIYSTELDGRYVSQNRLKKMLSHEINLIEKRLDPSVNARKKYFSYANTVATIDFAKRNQGHGWVGIRFQTQPLAKYNEIILHIRFRQLDATLQQETLGKLGVNLIYGAFTIFDNPRRLIKSLYDYISKDELEIDMVNFGGPCFAYVDNRLMSLQLVKNKMTDAVIFGPDEKNVLPADLLYKKNILALRGSFRPVTKVNMDMMEGAYDLFLKRKSVKPDNVLTLFEITLSNLSSSGLINERDFLDRVDILCGLDQMVLISNFSEYYKLIEYFSKYTQADMALAMGVNNLLSIFDEKYYGDLSGGIMEAFGKLFTKNLKVYLYPYLSDEGEMLNSNNLKVGDNLKDLYKYFKTNDKIIDITDYDKDFLKIFSRDVLCCIAENGNEKWEDDLPEGVADIIKERELFNYRKRKRFL